MILMHENTPVAILDETLQIVRLINPSELPVGVLQPHPSITNQRLLMWFGKRTIPNNRIFGEKLQQKLGCSFKEAMLRANSVSLTDTYWLKAEGDATTWEHINYYDKSFSNKTTEKLLNGDYITDFAHPTFTTDGVLEKTWILLDDIPYLLKFDENKNQLIGEVFATKVANMMNIPHVAYNAIEIEGSLGVACPCLIDNPHTDMVFAMQYTWEQKVTGIGLYEHLSNMDYEGLQKMLLFDYLTRQEDRHAYNFAFANEKLLPIYDSGRCLSDTNLAKPFCNSRTEISNLITMPFALPSFNSIRLAYKEACEEFKVQPQTEKILHLNASYNSMEILQERLERDYDGTDLERE